MHLTRVSIVLCVGDARHSVAFYEALLGGPPTSSNASKVVFESEVPALVLTLETCPPTLRTRDRTASGLHPSRKRRSECSLSTAHGRFALVVPKPEQVGQTAIALRRAGARLRLQDQGLEACDPDGNHWRVRFVPFTQERAVVELPVEREDETD
jgi:catechol-2,3-dioxygenase